MARRHSLSRHGRREDELWSLAVVGFVLTLIGLYLTLTQAGSMFEIYYNVLLGLGALVGFGAVVFGIRYER